MSEEWLQAQYSVLGSALIESSLVPKIIQLTSASDFRGSCQTVYLAMRKLFLSGSPVDPVTLNAALKGEYKDFLAELMLVTPTTANLDHYIHLCRDQSRIFAIHDLGRELQSTSSVEDIRKLLEIANGQMVDKPSLRITTMADALKSFMDRHTGKTQYLGWPISELNDRLYAEPGDFILIGGLPSSGKSAFAIQCGWHWAQGMKVGFFSLETSSEKLFDRQMSAISGLTMDDIKRNNISDSKWTEIAALSSDIVKTNLELIPAAGMTPADVRSVTMMRGYQLIIIDYVQLLLGSGGNRTEQVTNISMALHRMAQNMGVTVVALSQLKRKNDDSAPDNSDLRESGQLEQDADIILILKLEKKDDPDGNRYLYITKNKEGTTPKILLAFDGKHQTFTKAQRTGEVVQQLKAYANKEKRRRREADYATWDSGQMTILPPSTPVPFTD
ncbi:MAG: AAA family ATPase [Oscillospiraceae bacterium]|nr:AAA family ATPase [Oscillospiraceae bacterium]